MQKKLKSGQYKNKAQFQHDLDLIWDNCLLYNASPQHPLRRNATLMRKKANHLLGFLSEKSEIKDMLTHWQPPAAPKPSEEARSSAPPPAPPAPPREPDAEDGARFQGPFAQRVALRRSAESTLVFADLDPRLAARGVQGDADAAGPSDARALPAALAMLQQVQQSPGVDPLGAALGVPRPPKDARIAPHGALHAWWAACGSDAMVCAGLPTLPHPGRTAPGAEEHEAPPMSRLPTQRRGIPRMMARNIRTLRRLHHTHQKFFRLADVVEHELPIPADLAQASSDEEEEEAAPESPGVPPASSAAGTSSPAVPPRLLRRYAREQVEWQVRTLLAHAGFDGSHTNALQVLTDVTREYMMGLARTLRLYADRFGAQMSAEEMVVHALHNSGGTHVRKLDAYVKNDIERYGVRLREWLRKLQTAYKEQLTNLGRAAVEDDELLARDGEALALGHFAEGLGDDFFGFRELGLDRELGLAGLSVPSRLFFGRGNAPSVVAADGERKSAPTYSPPPPVVLVSRASLPAQIGLLRPWYAAHLAHGAEAQSTDVVPEAAPERPRYKVPMSGKLPPRALYGEASAEPRAAPVEKKTPSKAPPPAKRKRGAAP